MAGIVMALAGLQASAQEAADRQLDPLVVSASRTEQRRFDAPASIDSINIDGFRAGSALVNLTELSGAIPGVIVRDRENFAQDLQLSIRGFGTRSTFGVRGVRLLVDGIPATMPDGQGQISTASLASARRIEVLRGPLAQLYGNAAGGVLQVFTEDPPKDGMTARISAGAGADGQRLLGAQAGAGTDTLGALIDVTRFSTDGYRDHSAARRTQVNVKLVGKLSADTTLTGIVNGFSQPDAQDPLGLTRAAFESNPRQAIPAATIFDTRKSVEQWQSGLVLDHRISAQDTLNGRVYVGKRDVNQTLAFSGAAANSAGGVVDLDREYGGIGLSWTHRMRVDGRPLDWTLGVEADRMNERRRGFVNDNGAIGALRRDEDNEAANVDVFGQLDWVFAERWRAIAGFRASRVRFSVDDNYVTAASPNDSGAVRFTQTSPVAGLVWHARHDLNLYANLGRGFETPTLAESAYRIGGTGPNFGLQASTSTQAEVGMKLRRGDHRLDFALFDARSKGEIVLQSNTGGRSVFQNAGRVQRRGAEASWHADWSSIAARMAYTLLDARFRQRYASGASTVAQGNRLPGAAAHQLYAEVEVRPQAGTTAGFELRAQGKTYVDDINSDAAAGYAVVNLRAGQELRLGGTAMQLFARIDNLFDRRYAGSVIVNESNGRYFEPAAGRRLFVGLRTLF
jgi:iron complex outermembrane receptor protein